MTRDIQHALLTTASGKHCLSLCTADTFFTRLRGLILAPPLAIGHGMLLPGCRSVHTCFMRQPLDLLYLDRHGVVTRCVAGLRPWRASTWHGTSGVGTACVKAAHVLELAAGSIALFQIRIGDQLQHTLFIRQGCARSNIRSQSRRPTVSTPRLADRQRGSAMIEFAVVAPIITLLGLATVQYGLIFFAKNQYNHAAFMAARAGSVANANLDTITDAYVQALIPLYGGGTNAAQLATSYNNAKQAAAANLQIVMLNPTAESFADFNDPDLQQKLGLTQQRVIPNGGLAFKKAAIVQANSGQNVQDANLLKLRITYAYKPQVPLVGSLYRRYLEWLDPGTNAFHTQRLKNGFIPVVSNVTMQMQSDVIEGTTVSIPGPGNGGLPTNAGSVQSPQNPRPVCSTVSCGSPVSEGVAVNQGVPGTAGPQNPTPPAPPETPPGGMEPGIPETAEVRPGGVCEKAPEIVQAAVLPG